MYVFIQHIKIGITGEVWTHMRIVTIVEVATI